VAAVGAGELGRPPGLRAELERDGGDERRDDGAQEQDKEDDDEQKYIVDPLFARFAFEIKWPGVED